jgi:multiple sugar transport system substrate-binding protein
MENRMKRVLLLLMLMLLTVTLVWSGGQSDSAKSDTGKPFDGIKIRVIADQRAEVVKLKELTKSFEEETGMKVEYVIMGNSPLDEKVALEFSAPSTSIDVSFLKFFLVKDYAEKGFIDSLDEYTSGSNAFSQFNQSVLDIGRVNEKQYAIPQMVDPNILLYRADIFEKYNLEVPKTMDELMATAKFITENVDGMYGIVARGGRGARPNWNWSSFLKAWGGNYLDSQGRPTVNTPEAVAALEFFTDLLTNYGPPGVSDYNWQDVQDSMAAGKVAMMYDGVSLAKRIADPIEPSYSPNAENFSFAIVPKGPAARESGYFTWMLVMPKNNKQENKKASVAFIEWAFSSEIAKQVGWGAASELLFDVPGYSGYKSSQNLKDVYAEALNYSSQNYRPVIPQLPQLMDIVDLAINMSLSGVKPAKVALDEAQVELEKLLIK